MSGVKHDSPQAQFTLIYNHFMIILLTGTIGFLNVFINTCV